MNTHDAESAFESRADWAFRPELDFTNTYRAYRDRPKGERELACLRTQLPHMLQPMAGGDLIAGRTAYFTVGMHHIVYGQGPSNGIDRAGYCFDRVRIEEKLARVQPGTAEREAVRRMCEFWEHEHTVGRIRARFTPEMHRVAPTDDWVNRSAVVHPLYRIAEFQPDHAKLVRLGLPGLRRELEVAVTRADRYGNAGDARGGDRSFLASMLGALDLVESAIDYYIDDVERRLAGGIPGQHPTGGAPGDHPAAPPDDLREIRDSLVRIRNVPPARFRDALQLVWIFNVTAGVADFHRLDSVLGDLYVADIESGIITEENAIELLGSLWGIIDEIYARNSRVIVGGRGRTNANNADRLAAVIIEATKRRRALFPQTSLRCSEGMDERLLDAALDALGDGITYPILYNDDVNIPGVAEAFDVTTEVALDYSFFGCGEYILGHRSIGTPNVIINLSKILEITMHGGRDPATGEQLGLDLGGLADFATFEQLLDAYDRQTRFFVEQAAQIQELIYDVLAEECTFLLQGMLLGDVIERGLPVLDGGIQHLGGTIESYGNITTADSLAAIRHAVYEAQNITPENLLAALDANFDGFDRERRLLLAAPKYGNDDDRADEMAAWVHERVCNISREQRANTRLDSFIVVEINNSANANLGCYVGATPDGRYAGDVLSNANGPVQGRDTSGITALLNSLSKMRSGIHAGITQNLKFSRQLFNGDRVRLKQLLATFFELGGTQANITVVSREDLERAMIEPEKYRNLIVRIGGYSCRFVDLDRRAQEDMIRRTIY